MEGQAAGVEMSFIRTELNESDCEVWLADCGADVHDAGL